MTRTSGTAPANAASRQPGPARSPNRVRRCWQRDEAAIGTFVFSRDPDVTEIVGHAGMDFAIIDMEHAPLGIGEVSAHLRAADAAGITGIVRLPGPDHGLMGKLLDAGASGLMLPHFGRDREASKAFCSTLRYAPQGDRPSCTGVRAARFALGSYAEHVAHSNADLIGIGLVEDIDALPNLDSLFDGAGLDAVMPGPGDLSTSMGLYGQPTHPRVREAVDVVIGGARRAGLRVGMYLNSPQEIDDWKAAGLDFFVYLFDTKLLAATYASATTLIRGRLAAGST
ncbi:MAG: HpcH/HpaI aldolase/citrate lyase family protein [Lautropia sp.]